MFQHQNVGCSEIEEFRFELCTHLAPCSGTDGPHLGGAAWRGKGSCPGPSPLGMRHGGGGGTVCNVCVCNGASVARTLKICLKRIQVSALRGNRWRALRDFSVCVRACVSVRSLAPLSPPAVSSGCETPRPSSGSHWHHASVFGRIYNVFGRNGPTLVETTPSLLEAAQALAHVARVMSNAPRFRPNRSDFGRSCPRSGANTLRICSKPIRLWTNGPCLVEVIPTLLGVAQAWSRSLQFWSQLAEVWPELWSKAAQTCF